MLTYFDVCGTTRGSASCPEFDTQVGEPGVEPPTF